MNLTSSESRTLGKTLQEKRIKSQNQQGLSRVLLLNDCFFFRNKFLLGLRDHLFQAAPNFDGLVGIENER